MVSQRKNERSEAHEEGAPQTVAKPLYDLIIYLSPGIFYEHNE